jgi:hypothetical protein
MTAFLYVDAKSSTLNIARIPQIFDLKKAPKFTDSFVLKQVVFEGRCVKKAILHTSSVNNK